MAYSRRRFLQWAAAVSAAGVPRRLGAAPASGYRPEFLPSQREIWDQQTWMAKLGPKYTGNKAHTEFVEFLATTMKQLGLEVTRERYTFPRWEARRWSVAVAPADAAVYRPAVTSYFPYSGRTDAAGVTGALVYAGANPGFALDNLQGKIALIDCPVNARKFAELFQTWGVHPSGERFPVETRPARGPVGDLIALQKAGALAVILAWTDISDENAADQRTRRSRGRRRTFPAYTSGVQTGAGPGRSRPTARRRRWCSRPTRSRTRRPTPWWHCCRARRTTKRSS
jgi:hypothetical protein